MYSCTGCTWCQQDALKWKCHYPYIDKRIPPDVTIEWEKVISPVLCPLKGRGDV